MDFETKLVDILKKTIEKYPKENEIEVRLGKKEITRSGHKRFNPDLGEKKFHQLLGQLIQEYKTYDKYEFNEHQIGTLRLRLDMNGNQIDFIRKKRLSNEDIQMDDNFDARVSVSSETPMEEPFRGEPHNEPTHKLRYVFKDKGYQFELSEVTRNLKGLERTEYYLEIELLGH